MKNENCEERKDKPTIRITAIWGDRDLSALPPKDICLKAAQACGHLLSMLGFTHCAIGVGSLENCINNSAAHDKDLMDAAKFDAEATTISDGVPVPKPTDKLKNVTISVEDMLKGIDLNKTCEDK